MSSCLYQIYKTGYIAISCLVMLVVNGCGNKNSYELSVEQQTKVDTLHVQQINLYLETSASMRGYVNANVAGSYPLKDVVPFMVTDLNNAFDTEMGLYTISDRRQKFPYSKSTFFERLRNGRIFTGKSSKLQNVFTGVVAETHLGEVSILITDCIPDLGKVNTKTEGSKITSHIYNSIAGNKTLGVAVYKYASDFNGTHYFDRKNNNGVSQKNRPFYNEILKNRPFYVWIFGEPTLVAKVVSKNIIKDHEATHTYNLPLQKIGAGLLKYPKSGKISISPEKNLLTIKEISNRRPAVFTIGMNLNKLSNLQQKQITDTLNYEVVPAYAKGTIGLNIKNKNALLSGKIKGKYTVQNSAYTHFMQPTLHDLDLDTETIHFDFINREPPWVQHTALEDDVGTSATDLEHKTFGFRLITEAFNKAFPPKNKLFQFILTKQN